MTVDSLATSSAVGPSALASGDGHASAQISQSQPLRHKHVTFDTLPAPLQQRRIDPTQPNTAPILPTPCAAVPQSSSASLPTSAGDAMPPCSQLELSAFDPYSQQYSNPFPPSAHRAQQQQPIRIGAPDPMPPPPPAHQPNPFDYDDVPTQHQINTAAADANITEAITQACAAVLQRHRSAFWPPATATATAPVHKPTTPTPPLGLMQKQTALSNANPTPVVCTNPFLDLPAATAQPPNNNSVSNEHIAGMLAHLLGKNVQITEPIPPPPVAVSTDVIGVSELHSIVIRQQEQIREMQQQIDELMEHMQCSGQLPVVSTEHIERDDVALGEEASTTTQTMIQQQNHTPHTPVNGQRAAAAAQSDRGQQQPQQQQQSNHNSPADWKFYGNTLEQVLDVLHNSPGSGGAVRTPQQRQQPPQPATQPQVHNLFHMSHVQGDHFTDVNVSATQRVTYCMAQTTSGHTSAQQTPTPSAVTDRSLAMNTLALKYLDESGLHALVAQSHTQQHQHFGAQRQPVQRPHQRQPTDMSAKSLDYLVKYGLLQNRRLFDANNNGDHAN